MRRRARRDTSTALEQVVLDLIEDERLEEASGIVPARFLTRVEHDELELEVLASGPGDQGFGLLGQAVVRVLGELVFEVVVRDVLDFGEVALRGQAEEGTLVVAVQLRVDDLPADRLGAMRRYRPDAPRPRSGSRRARRR
jgi:hypothetical protein